MKKFFGKQVTRRDGSVYFRVDPDFRGISIIMLLFTLIFMGMGSIALADDVVSNIKLPDVKEVRQLATVCNDGDAMLDDILFNEGIIALKCYERELKRIERAQRIEVARR